VNDLFGKTSRPVRVLLVFSLLVVMALQLVHVTHTSSATWDEPHHLIDGYTVWTQHDYRLNPEVPPLVKLIAALPLLRRSLIVPPNQDRGIPTEAFREGRSFVFGNGPDRTLQPGRVVCMAFTLALGLFIYLFAAETFGYTAGLFGLALFVFDPNFLAHGALITTDAGSACLFLAAVYAFYRYCIEPSWIRLLLIGLATGLLLAAKFTGIFIFPMLILLALLEWLLARSGRILWQRLAAVVAVCLCAWVVIWAFYGFRYKAAPAGRELNPPLTEYLGKMYDQKNAKHLAALARWHALPEAYIWGLENTKQTEFEDTSYFWGKVYRHGNWAYFPVAFLVKSTLPFLLLLLLGVIASKWGLLGNARASGFLLIPSLIYFAISMRSDMNIGARHLLPVYAFLYVLTGGIAATLIAHNRSWALPLGLLLAWQIFTSVRIAPAYMAYGNEAWGGPSRVHRYLSDANVDWGQQLFDVKAYLDARQYLRPHNCWFAYFPDGAIEPSDYGINCKRLPTTDNLWWLDLPMSVPPVIDGTVLISDSDLEGIEFGDGALNPYDSFRGVKPVATLQHGIDVYEGSFPVPLASALVTAHEAQKLAAAGQLDAALAKAEAATLLAPGSAAAQITYADILLAHGNRVEALDHYRVALRNAQTVRPDLQAGSIADLQAKINALQASPPKQL
jgi:Dolichyl-phosphate-mannose-protein mannosyltransferase